MALQRCAQSLLLLLEFAMIHALCLAPLLTAAPGLTGPTPLADVFVDIQAANCATGTGSSTSPVCSIAAGISLASPGDTIRIAAGTYIERVSIPFDLDLIGTAGASVTFLDGGGAAGPDSVVTIPAAVTVTIEGLSIQNGNSFFSSGGGIFVAGSLALSNSTVSGNRAPSGGGLATDSATSANLVIENCLFESNFTTYSGTRGGALDLRNASCTISDSTFQGNGAERGGAIALIGADSSVHVLTIENSTIAGNGANSLTGAASGGGLSISGGRLNLSGCTVSGNSAFYGRGGGIAASQAEISITNSTISTNLAGGDGIIGSSPGGGILLAGGTSGSISNSTIVFNEASLSNGGGILALPTVGVVTVQNTIVAGNEGNMIYPPFSNQDVVGSLTSLGNNLIGDGGGSSFTDGVMGDQVGSLLSPLDPVLGALQNNGGSTETHAPEPSSPAVNAGGLTSFLPTDQRGISRPQGGSPDIGAFELVQDSAEFCNGDGGDGLACTPCPCGNDAAPGSVGGCLHSGGIAGRLVRSGSSSVTAQALRIEARSLPSNTAAILLSGAALAPNNAINPCFGSASGITSPTLDGLRCIVGNILRHGVRPADSNGDIGLTTNGWGTPNGFFNLSAFVAGQTRNFQITYRDDLAAQCMTGLNTTQAAQVTFVP